ncbi:MAG: TerB family tellurite resistance protein [Alphaproteobacteria bacterium]|nr:TerB family tellurite resistance protein [Alphaproteobacteria bacterium]
MDLKMETDMDCLAQLSEDQKIAFMKAFARLAAADGNVDEDEMAYIKNVAVVYGVSPQRVNEILKVDSDDEVVEAVKIINNRRAALELIKEMCILAHADDVLSDEETVLIGKVGMAMGVDLEKIEQISNWVIDRIIWLEEAKIIFEEV